MKWIIILSILGLLIIWLIWTIKTSDVDIKFEFKARHKKDDEEWDDKED